MSQMIRKKKNVLGAALAGAGIIGAVGVQEASADVISGAVGVQEASADAVGVQEASADAVGVQEASADSVGVQEASADAVGAVGVQEASADVIYTSESGSGYDTIVDDSNTPNQSIVNLLNSQIRNLQEDSNGIIQIESTPKYINQSDVAKTQAAIAELSDMIAQYNDLKAKLDAQNANNQALNGMVGADNDQVVTGGTIDQSVTNMQDLLNQMQGMVDGNDKIIKDNAENKGEDNALSQKVTENNKAIANAAKNLNNYKNGIVGDLDDINRKSQDSEAAGGIIVDNTETQKVNTVVTEAEVKPDKVQVNSLTQADKELDRILGNISKQNSANVGEAMKAADYRANSLSNIDDINKWLGAQQKVAEKAKEDASKANTAINSMDKYKTETLKKLEDVKAKLIADKASQKMIDQVDDAIKKVKASGVKEEALPAVGSKDPIEFGDIGQKQDVQNGAQNGTIAKTKDEQAKALANAIENGVAQVQQSNTAAENAIKPKIDANTKSVDDFLEKIAKGGAGSQVDANYLNTMGIYTKNDGDNVKDFYKEFVDNAIAQTSDDVSAIQAQLKGTGQVSSVTGQPSIAQVSAAMYAENAGTMNDGFGSIMIPETNLNKLITDVGIVSGGRIFADSRTDGGSQAIYDALRTGPGSGLNPGDPGLGNGHLAAMKDWKNQYLDPQPTDSTKHAENTFTIITDSPSLRITLPKSFVYTDANGNTAAEDVQVTVGATAYNGDDISARLMQNAPTDVGTYGLFIYNFQVNPYTGQLVTGVSYIAMMGTYKGSGAGGAIGSGSGEMRLEDVERDNIDQRMSLGFESIGSPVRQSAANGVGLAQSIMVKVKPTNKDAVKYAQHAPLFVSDIDDGQQLIAYTTTGNTKIITAENQGHQTDTSDWKNPYTQPGNAISMTSKNDDSVLGTVDKSTKLDAKSAAIFSTSTGGNNLGLTNTRVTMRSKGDPATGNNYMAIDTSLFAPFGIVGAPSLSIDQVNANVKTLEVNVPTAKAETKGSYKLESELEYMYTGTYAPQTPKNISGLLGLQTFLAGKGTEAGMSSNNSFVVQQQGATSNKTASGNSLVVQQLAEREKTGSGNSLVVQSTGSNTITGSGNSLVVITKPVAVVSGSGDSLVVQTIADADKAKNNIAMKLTAAQPKVTENLDGTHDVTISVYSDANIMGETKAAMDDWTNALRSEGVNLKVNYTSDVNHLRDGVTLAIMEADNNSEIASSLQKTGVVDETMNGLGGLMTEVKYNILNPNGDNDKYNKTGTVTAGDALKNSLFTIQLNTEGLATQAFKNSLMGGKLNENVLKHEIGHVFGLNHDDDDSLMTTYVTDSMFNGKITNGSAFAVANNLVRTYGRDQGPKMI